jgi:effector-binding domain-containing protein
MGLEIIDDSDWKKPDAVRKEISRQCLKFFTERGIEPHYADCLIRYKDNYDTVEVRIAIGMDVDTEKDDDIFFYCDTLEDMKSLAEIGCEDFCIADCYGFGVYEDLL